MPTLVLMRHGATIWGEENRFAGWGDTPLSAKGLDEARAAAKAMRHQELRLDLYLTSRLTRARQTLDAVVAELGMGGEGVKQDWRLNERHYGALQGETRAGMIARYGNKQVVEWRRSYDATPPFLDSEDARWREQLERLPDLAPADHPRGESLGQAVTRMTPSWHSTLVPALAAGMDVLVVAHTSSIRGIVKNLERLSDRQAAAFRIATAVPRIYALDSRLNVIGSIDLAAGMASQFRSWANRFKPRRLGWI